MTTLYVAPGACSFGAHVALKELGIPHTVEVVPLRVPDSPIFKVNPLGRVPALKLDSGEVITENSAILPYLADLKPEAGLLAPAGSVERAKIQEWIGFLNSDVHGALKPINRPNLYHPDESAHDVIREHSKPRLLDFLKVIDSKLAGKTWAVGERFTIADAYLGVFWTWLKRGGLPLAAYPNLVAFGQRFDERPSVKAALLAETPVSAAA
ncbi:MAG: glutathione S-transferase protein [Proteobacteria bacterium]|nr:glutathione S-transferase protein [Pseudomonadota bacterium]